MTLAVQMAVPGTNPCHTPICGGVIAHQLPKSKLVPLAETWYHLV